MTTIPTRDQIDAKDKWRLEDIYPTQQAWEQAYVRCEQLINAAAAYKGKVGESADTLVAFLETTSQLSAEYEKVMCYAYMREHEDTKDTHRQQMAKKMDPLGQTYGEKLSFFSNELLAIDEEVLASYYEQNERLRFYKASLDQTLREKEHILTPEEEDVIAKASRLFNASKVFDKLDDTDIAFDPIIKEDGTEIPLTHGTYGQYIHDPDRLIRKQAFENLYRSYDQFKNTYAAIYDASLNEDVFSSSIRHYPSSLHQALFSDNVSVDVYNNLIDRVKANASTMHRYVALRKKMMGLDELHMYDMYAPLVPEAQQELTYEQAYDTMKEGLAVLGDEYINLLEEARTGGWIDVYETDGKASGAYAWGPYGVHPYVLLNHRKDMNSMFTLAHEMGHAMHSHFSDRENPKLYAQYVIFVAEVASTVNEVLLMHHLLNKTNDKTLKMSLINEFLEKFKSTLFRQTMFAEFEKIAHEKVENDEPMTADAFSDVYYQLNKEYYGDALVHDEQIRLEWARISHFYRSFYVYQYATGFSAAIAIADRILKEGQPAVDDYLAFLQSGGRDYPIELLKIAGVDMSQSEPIDNALRMFGELVDELETLHEEK